MKDQQEFLDELAEAIGYEGSLTPAVELNSDIWDSMAIVATIGLVDERYNVAVSGGDLQECKTVADLVQLIEKQLQQQA